MLAPPTQTFNLDVEAISGICGSISIACWVVVFSPQIIQNFQRASADALSIQFIIVWLIGDIFNILGAVLQRVLPTMIILAIYYTIADLVLLAQCFYYRGFTWRDPPAAPPKPRRRPRPEADERSALLSGTRRESRASDWPALSPAVPHLPTAPPPQAPPSALQTIAWNSTVIVMVVAAGIMGWALGERATGGKKTEQAGGEDALTFSVMGQFFGYLCAIAYVASRLPQLILNWRRKTTDGLSMLFFLFACLGNMTYVLSIIAYEPKCREATCEEGEARRIYGRYILVNLSWIIGSLFTLFLDLGVFAQYFMYRSDADGTGSEDDFPHDDQRDSWDNRPILQRDEATYP